MGHSHVHRPYLSRRDFLRKAAIASTAAVSGPYFWRQLAYAADAPVTGAHVTFGSRADSVMSVSWSTPAPVRSPFVDVLGSRVAARTAQYAGYQGYFHHAEVAALPAGSDVAYALGHDDQVVAGTSSRFRTGPDRRTAFTFTAFGDQGTDSPPLGQPPKQPSMNTDLARRFSPEFHLIVGDLAYANGDQTIWDDWFTMIEPMARTTPWMPTLGNHEIESQITGAAGDAWGAFGYDPYRTRFALPANGTDDLSGCYYAFRYGSVHVICIDNNDVNSEIKNNIGYTGGRQQLFVERELAAARNDPDVDFIVVSMHQCAFSSSTKHGSDEGVRTAWFDLFHRYSVDLVLQGHDHTYERTHAMVGDQVVSAGPVYRSDVGTLYVVCGNGGAVQEPFKPEQPAWSAFRQALKVGTLKIDVDPHAPNGMRRMTLSEHWALDGSVIEGAIVLERPPSGAVVLAESIVATSGEAAASSPDAGNPVSPSTVPPTTPARTLAATGGPAGIAVVGVGAAVGGLALRTMTREERREELADL